VKKRLLYIGNKLGNNGGTATTIDVLSVLLQEEGYTLRTASPIKNKVGRFLDMLFKTFYHRMETDLVLIDTYSTQNFLYAVGVASLCRIFKIPYIPILHGGNLFERLEKSPKLSRKLFKGAKINVAPSQYLLQEFQKKGYTNLVYIPNTIEIKKYPFLLRKSVSLKLLWVRSFAKIYNPLLAVHVLKNLIDEGYKAQLCMVGPDKDGSLKMCKDLAREYNLPVTFTGKLEKEEWVALSAEYDIFINTTNFDNMPVSIIEAMALGIPIISTNVGGIPYLIEDKKNGLLVPPNDIEAIQKQIIRLLKSDSLAKKLSVEGRKKAESFDWDKVKHNWFPLLNN